MICSFPQIIFRIFKNNSRKFIHQCIGIFSNQLWHKREVDFPFFRQWNRQSFTGCIYARDNFRFFNGALRKHIRFTFKISVVIKFFQRTKQKITGILAKCPFVWPRVDKTIFLSKGIIHLIKNGLLCFNGRIWTFVKLHIYQLLCAISNCNHSYNTFCCLFRGIYHFHHRIFTIIHLLIKNCITEIFYGWICRNNLFSRKIIHHIYRINLPCNMI